MAKPSERIREIVYPSGRGPLYPGIGKQVTDHELLLAVIAYLDEQAEKAGCECSHPKADHNHDEGECLAKVKVGNNNDFCPCEGFKQRG